MAIQRWKNQTGRCGSLEGIARLLDLASKLGRLAANMPTDKTEVATQVQGKLDIEWEIALKKIYGVAEGKVDGCSLMVDGLDGSIHNHQPSTSPKGFCGNSSVVERLLAKEEVTGSNPVSRSRSGQGSGFRVQEELRVEGSGINPEILVSNPSV